MRVGVVGNGSDKFTKKGEEAAKDFIRSIVSIADVIVSGHSPVGGIDIWAEDEANIQGVETDIKAPKDQSWGGEYGYKARNLDIARDSDTVYVILADVYPEEYRGHKFTKCYHCNSDEHVKSGGCWTGKQAAKLGKPVQTIVVSNY
jgi:hypothetical protein